MHAQRARAAKENELKLSNKSRLEKLKKSLQTVNRGTTVILQGQDDPSPEIWGPGPILMVPDNGHRFPYKSNFQEDE